MKYLKLLSVFESHLDALEGGKGDVLFKAEKGIVLVEKSIRQLQKEITGKPFATPEDEIYFFKHIKPQIFSKLIYYVKLFNIESKRPRGNDAAQIKYLQNQIDKLQAFFNDNLEFYNYYRRGAMSLDEQYFIRGNRDLRLPLESFHFLIDDQFSTCHDGTVSTIMAYDMLIVYLKKEIDDLNINLETQKSIAMEKPSKLFWTGSKTDLIELIYALHASQSINGGTVDIKEMASHFEHFYNIDLGNYYHTFIEIRSRKTTRTRFLEKLIDALQHRMDSLDE
ncbi:RteC domain-containing protein [Cytophaga sp. FL35]|uniref:RteC domain-containing protein n=1 Tax=Cytophaga sp. FL35 TaxID=1904456 RepID=UPI000C415F03|nr:RteC domain-containing protein [Cytophaga sp. FL35]MAU70559.1 tetracycline regulation of excision, RteC [Pseudozobellia sp.]MBC7000465.1 RteC domain-containing protein [Cytophaga sp. FL35]MBG48047.1 tetracycline regulation of excision, RteC [Pseudozobellia sp.]|tara:strand:- start:346 stop:1185 length:840 start_codon:yes stop_codon:yes gene_type:complete